jgi:FtsH-binding integral membrane protein
MAMYPQYSGRKPIELDYSGVTANVAFRFFNIVYAWMCVGLVVTAVVAYAFSQSPQAMSIFYSSKLGYVAWAIGAVGIAWLVQVSAMRISATLGTLLFMLYAAVIGGLISGIFLIYDRSTIVSAFLLTAGTFAAMSIYGFVTKRDLIGIGSFLVMCFVGLFIASLVNVFMGYELLGWIITYGVLAVFIGITAYETQMLKNLAYSLESQPDKLSRYAIVGSLMLYVAFINMFLAILRILGRSND